MGISTHPWTRTNSLDTLKVSNLKRSIRLLTLSSRKVYRHRMHSDSVQYMLAKICIFCRGTFANSREGYFPITPAATPFSTTNKTQRAAGTRTAGSSPTRKDPNLTIKASHAMKRGSSCQEAFSTNAESCGAGGILSPPHSASQVVSRSADTTTFPPLEFQCRMLYHPQSPHFNPLLRLHIFRYAPIPRMLRLNLQDLQKKIHSQGLSPSQNSISMLRLKILALPPKRLRHSCMVPVQMITAGCVYFQDALGLLAGKKTLNRMCRPISVTGNSSAMSAVTTSCDSMI